MRLGEGKEDGRIRKRGIWKQVKVRTLMKQAKEVYEMRMSEKIRAER